MSMDRTLHLRTLASATTLALALAASTLAAQQPSGDAPKKPSAPKTLTLTGCVEKGSTPNQFTLQDEANGKYEVSGSDIKKYVGQRVQVLGTPGPSRFKVKGGLYPTPNVAGQAGAMDPAKAAIAAQPGGGARGTGDIDLPTLKVQAVRALDNACR
jgi:hypothetical protein